MKRTSGHENGEDVHLSSRLGLDEVFEMIWTEFSKGSFAYSKCSIGFDWMLLWIFCTFVSFSNFLLEGRASKI